MTLRKKAQAVRKYMKHRFSSVEWKRRDKALSFPMGLRISASYACVRSDKI